MKRAEIEANARKPYADKIMRMQSDIDNLALNFKSLLTAYINLLEYHKQHAQRAIVFVQGGVAELIADDPFCDVAIIDADNINAGDPPAEFPESWRDLLNTACRQGLYPKYFKTFKE